MPCDMCELAQQLPEGGQRGDLVAGNNIQAEGFGGFWKVGFERWEIKGGSGVDGDLGMLEGNEII